MNYSRCQTLFGNARRETPLLVVTRNGVSRLALLAAYGAFEIVYSPRADKYEFFRPEFESGYVILQPHRIEFRRAFEEPIQGWSELKIRDGDKAIFVSPTPEITGKDIRRATVRIAEIFPGHQACELYIQFTAEGAKKMERFTENHRTQPVAVLIDGKLRAAPRVFSTISSDAQLTGVFTLEEAARMIREGANQ